MEHAVKRMPTPILAGWGIVALLLLAALASWVWRALIVVQQ